MLGITTPFSLFGKGAPRGVDDGTVVLLSRAILCSHMLSVRRIVVSGTGWAQFAMQVLTGGCEPPVLVKGWS